MQDKFFPGSTPLQVKALMMDASDALCNGATKALAMEDGQVLSCFFHVLQNVDKHKSRLHKLALQEIKADIWRLHLSRTKESQEALTRATLYKWRAAGDVEFAEYFEKQYLTGRWVNWTLPLMPKGTPATDNPLESFN
ncbi:hypothetical protein B484DRAFT_340720, partial [Ochromonadaceae sp. CCMP2298]